MSFSGGGDIAAETTAGLRECRRCLLSEIPGDIYYATLRAYVDALPDNIKAAPDLYGRRLSLCKQCDDLLNGMCRHCGCFVELRAAKRLSYCAGDRRIW